MKKIIFKTTGWILLAIVAIGVFQTDPVENPWEFILKMFCFVIVDDMFDLDIGGYAGRLKDWFIK